MTLRQYLTHLWFWLRTFPRWRAEDCTFTGRAGSGEYRCLVCGAWEDVNEAEAEDE